MVTFKDRVVVKQDDIEKIKHGIIVDLNNLEHQRPNRGVVVAVGEQVSKVKTEDKIFFSMYAGRKLKYKGVDYIVMLEKEVFGVIPADSTNIVDTGQTTDHGQITENLNNGGSIFG